MEEQMSQMMDMMKAMSQEQRDMKEKMLKLEEKSSADESKATPLPTEEQDTLGRQLPRREVTESAKFRSGPKVDPPPKFAGKEEDWRMFGLKMRSFYGNYLEGQMGEWMDNIRDHREQDCRIEALGAEARKPAEMLYQGLIAFCEGDAFTIVENAGEGEGLEAWRSLYHRYDVQTRQSRVSQLMQLLDTEVRSGDVFNCLAKFERDWQRWESKSKKDWDELVNDLKIGVVLKGLEAGPMKTQLLLESEKCTSYDTFRRQVETVARASSTGQAGGTSVEQLQAQLEAFKGGKGAKSGSLGVAPWSRGKGGFDGKCNNCGKSGHKKADCYLPGGDAHKPGKGGGKSDGKTGGKNGGGKGNKACFQCGMMNHVAKDCRASEEKKKKYKESLGKGGRAQELQPGSPGLGPENLGHLCQLHGNKDRTDEAEREIVFNVDSGASKTVVKASHKAVRGYKIHKDGQTGVPYNTAGKQKIQDEGRRVLQIKAPSGEKPWRMNTRVAEVRNSLLSPSEMAKCGHDVLLRNEDGYAIHRETGATHKFERTPGGWQFKVELEAPEVANKVWELHRLAELKPKEETWKVEAAQALKDMLGMKDYTQMSKEKLKAFGDAFRRLEEAEKREDPTIYPFHRRR